MVIKSYWVQFSCLLVLVCAHPKEYEEECSPTCVGDGYVCIHGQCYCSDGYLPNPLQRACLKCPGLGDKCHGMCCSHAESESLHCWQGVCQPCYNSFNEWICRPMGRSSPYDSRLSIGSLQIYVEERLRDAPPRYSTSPPDSTPHPGIHYVSDNFTHDHGVPPPPYTPENKNEDNQIATTGAAVHI
ncbi:uncharacterized protein LOC131847266 isoform X2 [Achroia grisella]|uniref:uncharacterized protein LOC131847266 isoform X2 n=1 Tax=Achroia grisella TaxID=688607 RepID=UPI0027D3330A|nr:uncharacterized protein LOC131847266 isoform X2 [Achroia grisella]